MAGQPELLGQENLRYNLPDLTIELDIDSILDKFSTRVYPKI